MRMKHDPPRSGKRKSVNLSIDTDVVAAAREAGINLSQISEGALRVAIRKEQERVFREENKAAFDYWNKWVEQHGLPLEKYRLF